MKNKFDPRHIRRLKNMPALFAWDCGNLEPVTKASPLIIENIQKIDSLISANAPKWPLDKINKVDLSILRQALWELTNNSETPPKVIIDEAVELAKEFGSESSSSFVNGVLGSVVKQNESSN